MATEIKKLKDFIEDVDERAGKDSSYSLEDIRGISSITKLFQNTKANLVDVSPSGYKVVEPMYFAYNPNTARMGDKIPIALNQEKQNVLVSSIYPVFRIKDTNELHPQYLWLWFKRSEFDRYARFKSHGSAREIFSWEEMQNVKLPIPTISTQKTIVNQYNSINSRINLLQSLIEKIDKLAMMKFRDLYKNTLKKEECALDSIIHIYSGHAFKSDDFIKNGTHGLVTIKNVQDDGFVTDCSDRINPSNRIPNYVYLSDGDLLLSLTGNVGRTARVIGSGYVLNQRVAKIECKKWFYKSFVQCLLNSNEFRSEMVSMSSGTAQQNLSPVKLKQMKIQIPSEQLLVNFSEKVDVLLSMKHNYETEIDILESALNTLFTSKYLSKEEK